MSLIHELLYRSKDLARIDFVEYIGSLATNLLRAYGANPSGIKCRIEVDNVSLNVDTAIPCGLIINELVSNCLKHAFPDGREGEIRIRLHADGDNRFTLVINDNGIGLPKDFDVCNTQSLGLQLVDSLARQLSGTVELKGKDRTEFKITFAEVKRKDR